MAVNKQYYVNTGRDGELEDTSEADIDALLGLLKTKDKVVLHFHGGLVSKDRALSKAEELIPAYLDTGAHPVFFVWESDFLTVIRRNLGEIFDEEIFQILLRKLLARVGGRLLDPDGAKSPGGPTVLMETQVAEELDRGRQNEGEPFDTYPLPDEMEAVSDEEEQRLEQAFLEDPEFQSAVEEIAVESTDDIEEELTSRSLVSRRRASRKSLMSPEIVEEMKEDVHAERDSRGLISSIKLAARAAKILYRVVRRFQLKRGHGIYTTVVEEILREFYIANIGENIWSAMKKETWDTFQRMDGKPTRGGWYFIQGLVEILKSGHRPKITLVGHSAGAVFICHLLEHLKFLQEQDKEAWPADFQFEHIVLLAPACNFELFRAHVAGNTRYFRKLRMFTMSDAYESDDTLVPVIYLRSLLYLISGILEADTDPKTGKKTSAFDKPLIGMERFHHWTDPYSGDLYDDVRQCFEQYPDSRIWSVTTGKGDGLNSDSISHGAFTDYTVSPRNQTMVSIQSILRS